jgi:hypothetical protein
VEGDEIQMDKLDKVPVPPATLVLRIVESGFGRRGYRNYECRIIC